MTVWNGEYISPYAEHGKKNEQVKKVTVSVPLKLLKILTDERTRRHQPALVPRDQRLGLPARLSPDAASLLQGGQPVPLEER